MTEISLCDVMIRRRASLPFPAVDPACSLNAVELAEASPTTTGNTSHHTRYTRKVRTMGTTRPVVDPTSSLIAVELAEASPDTRPVVDPTSSLIAVELAEASPDTSNTSHLGTGRGWRSGVTR